MTDLATELHPDAARTWSLLARRVVEEPDPRRRANLAVVARHVEAEVRGDLPALMSTLVAEPVYRIWGASASAGPCGHREVVAHYEAMLPSGKNRLEFEVTRVVADDRSVVTEGTFRHAYRGSTLAARAGSADVEPARWYLVEYRCLVVWPISADGLIEGEDIYAGEAPRIVRSLEAGECPHLGPVDRV